MLPNAYVMFLSKSNSSAFARLVLADAHMRSVCGGSKAFSAFVNHSKWREKSYDAHASRRIPHANVFRWLQRRSAQPLVYFSLSLEDVREKMYTNGKRNICGLAAIYGANESKRKIINKQEQKRKTVFGLV